MHNQVVQTVARNRGKNNGENKEQKLFQGGEMESLVVRVEMACSKCSWRLAFSTFSFARASLTSEILSFSRVWSYSRVSSEGPLEEGPGTGVKGVCFPYSDPTFCDLETTTKQGTAPYLVRHLHPHFLLQRHPEMLKN